MRVAFMSSLCLRRRPIPIVQPGIRGWAFAPWARAGDRTSRSRVCDGMQAATGASRRTHKIIRYAN